MKAFILDRYGGADRVRFGDMPEPQLREDDVFVQVRSAGVNLLDFKIRNAEFKRILPYRLPIYSAFLSGWNEKTLITRRRPS